MAFRKIVTHHGNFGAVGRKVQSSGNKLKQSMFGKINPQDRIDLIKGEAKLLIEYADCLQQIWDRQLAIDNGTVEDQPYIRLERIKKDENISESNRDG